MPKENEFVSWLCEQLSPMGTVKGRAMFGGWGIYCDGLCFAIVDDEVFYLKTDQETVARFEAAGSSPFVYTMKDGKQMSMSYWRIPDEALEDRVDLIEWSRTGLGAALRAQAVKKPKASKTPRKPTKA
ncbi:MAG: TfoX/Sxy family protein [Burkholderiales bacterium]|nr:TfoX/Sxy family protein [Burkholderiales bacterium]